jgi:hypothetical protein
VEAHVQALPLVCDIVFSAARDRVGAPLGKSGRATLVGEGTFKGGALDGYRCRMTYRGRVSPMPW